MCAKMLHVHPSFLASAFAQRDEAIAHAEAAEADVAELKRTLSQYIIDRASALALAERTQAENRAAAQALIVELGAPGPETLAETVARAIGELRRFRQERDDLRKLSWP